MLDLPIELWRCIAEFLPLEEVIGLYSVNQAFYHLAMDQRYREVKFDRVNKDVLQNIELLKYPGIARRVRSFHISPGLLCYTGAADVKPPQTKIKSFTSRIIRGLKPKLDEDDEIPTSEQIVQSIVDIIPNMTEVHTYGVSWQNLPESDTSIIDAGRSVFAHNLQHLRLSLRPTHLSSIPLHSILFPNLETLYIKFLMEPDDALTVDSLRTLASFINQQQPRLQKLAIRASRTIDVSALFLSLGDFKRLTSLDLDCTCTRYPQEATGVDPSIQFMNKHAVTIRDLSLSSKSTLLSNSRLNFQHLRLQNLTTLLLNSNFLVPNKDFWDEQLSVFLNNVSHTLESLVILGSLNRRELLWLLPIIGIGHSADGLRALSIGTASLTTELVVFISTKLPRLDSLTLRIHDVVDPEMPYFSLTPGDNFPVFESGKEHWFANHFREVSFDESFDEWALRDITIKRNSCCGELFLWGLMRLFAECIPTVKSFFGNGDMVIPDPPNQRKPEGTTSCSDTVCSYGRAGTRTSREFPSNYKLVYAP